MQDLLYFFQQLINGLTIGSTYALIAIGYTMVYGIIGMISFAHGEIYMIGAYTALITVPAWLPSALPGFPDPDCRAAVRRDCVQLHGLGGRTDCLPAGSWPYG